MAQRPPTSVSISSTQGETLGHHCIFFSPVSRGHIGVTHDETKRLRGGLMRSSISCYYITVNTGVAAPLHRALMFASLGEEAIESHGMMGIQEILLSELHGPKIYTGLDFVFLYAIGIVVIP